MIRAASRGTLLLAALSLGCPSASQPSPDPAPPAATPVPAPVAPPPPVAATPAPSVAPTIEALPDPSSFPDSATGLANGAFAPELARPDLLGGGEFRLSAHVGPTASASDTKVVIVGMVASWCGPCAASLPHLKELQSKHQGELEVVLVATDVDAPGRKAEADKVRAMGLEAVVLDPTEDDLRAWMGRKRNVPHFYIVNKAGEVLVQDRGFGNKVKRVLPGQVGYALRHPEYVDRSARR